MTQLQSPARAALIGIAAVALAILAKGAVNVVTGQDVAFIPTFVAVAVASMAGGIGAGVVVIGVGATVDAVIFQSPGGVLFDADPAGIVPFILFIPIILFIPTSSFIAWQFAGDVLAESERLHRLVVDMMGGRVWPVLRDGGGSEFGFALPILSVDIEPRVDLEPRQEAAARRM